MRMSSLPRWGLVVLLAGAALWLPARTLVENVCPLWLGSAELAGHVTDEDGRPVAGARVAAEFFGDRSVDVIPGSPVPAVTDEAGAFALRVVPGAMTLFARAAGLVSQPLDLEPRDDDELGDLRLVLDAGGRITGGCLGLDGKPRAGQWVTLEQAGYRHWRDEERIASVRTGASGEFVCEGVPCGEVRVCLGACFPFQAEQVVTVRRGETTRVHLVQALPSRP